MRKFSYKIAFSIISAGLFIVISFAALYYQNLDASFYMVAVPVVLFILLFGFAMGKTYGTPVAELLKMVSGVNGGNLNSKANVRTKDEIEELSKSFNKITEGLEKSVSEVENIKKTSDIKLKTKDIVSEKIIYALEEKIKNRTADLERAMIEIENLKNQLKAKELEVLEFSKKKKKTK